MSSSDTTASGHLGTPNSVSSTKEGSSSESRPSRTYYVELQKSTKPEHDLQQEETFQGMISSQAIKLSQATGSSQPLRSSEPTKISKLTNTGTSYHSNEEQPLNEYEDFSASDEEEIKPYRNPRLYQIPPDPNSPKAQRRNIERVLFERPITKGMLRRALQIYDLRKSYSSLSSDDYAALEKIFNMDDFKWSTEHTRRNMISRRVKLALKSLLGMYGFVNSTIYADYKSEGGHLRLKISPRPGRPIPELPKWLDIPYLVPAPGYRERLILEKCRNDCVQTGDKLYGPFIKQLVGTLGIVMRSGNNYVALTAGHILDDEQTTVILQRENDKPELALTVAGQSVRRGGRPLGRAGYPAGFQDDCAFLKINSNVVMDFSHAIPCVNPHHYSSEDVTVTQLADPLAVDRIDDLEKLLDIGSIVVYKRGATTDLTMGRFVMINDESPEGWFCRSKGDASSNNGEHNDNGVEHEQDDDVAEDYRDKNEWLGYVEWLQDIPFTAGGDSGALVYAMEGSILIPLGIHIGAPASQPNHSVFISLETLCFEAEKEKEGWSLILTNR